MIDLRTESERTLNLTQEHLNQTIKDKENENKNISLRCEELAFKVTRGESVYLPALGN